MDGRRAVIVAAISLVGMVGCGDSKSEDDGVGFNAAALPGYEAA
jgi:hypothetical protein